MARNIALSSETHQSILVLRNEGYSMWEFVKKLKISYNAVYYSLHRTAQTGPNQNRKTSGRQRCTTEKEDKYIRVSSLRNRHLTIPQLATSLNSTRKTPVSTSAVKRQLRDAGLLLLCFLQCWACNQTHKCWCSRYSTSLKDSFIDSLIRTVFSCANIIAKGFSNDQLPF